MHLSENEKELIINEIKAGRTLPKEYIYKLFADDQDVFLFWNGRNERVTNAVLPFHSIENIDEPRKDEKAENSLFDQRGRQIQGWTNKLIWGDNKLILSSLVNGPLREEIEKQGGLKLIYIDPPFAVGSDFSHNITIGNDSVTKKQSVIEEVAYRDTWGRGISSYLSMIYERIKLMHELLADDGSIYVHCDWRVNSYLKMVLDDIFGKNQFLNEVTWRRAYSHNDGNRFGTITDTIFFYSKSEKWIYNKVFLPRTEEETKTEYPNIDSKTKKRYKSVSMNAAGSGQARYFGEKGLLSPPNGRHWIWKQERINKAIGDNIIFFSSNNVPRYKQYAENIEGKQVQNLWSDFMAISSQSNELLNYPTQKPEALLERIIKASSNEGDLIADFFCGSGTTAAVAEKLGRKWITTDLGRFSIHTTRKRLINIQRQRQKDGKEYRAFEVLNLGKYERQFFFGIPTDISPQAQAELLEQKQERYVNLILEAYNCKAVENFRTLHGKKFSNYVHVGPLNVPVTKSMIDEIYQECKEKIITQVDILAFEFEMNLTPFVQQEYTEKGVNFRLRYIPKEVFDQRAVDKKQVKFYDVAYLEAKPKVKDKKVSIELKNFVTSYTQDDLEEITEKIKKGSSKVIIESGQIIKITKEKNGITERIILTEHWTDWIDYWSIDFNYENKKEIIQIGKNGKAKNVWSGNYIFENEWQSFRTKKDNQIELESATHQYPQAGKYKIMVKVIDILGVDTSQIIEIQIK